MTRYSFIPAFLASRTVFSCVSTVIMIIGISFCSGCFSPRLWANSIPLCSGMIWSSRIRSILKLVKISCASSALEASFISFMPIWNNAVLMKEREKRSPVVKRYGADFPNRTGLLSTHGVPHQPSRKRAGIAKRISAASPRARHQPSVSVSDLGRARPRAPHVALEPRASPAPSGPPTRSGATRR